MASSYHLKNILRNSRGVIRKNSFHSNSQNLNALKLTNGRFLNSVDKRHRKSFNFVLSTNFCTNSRNKKGLVLGVYETEDEKFEFSTAAEDFNLSLSGRLTELVEISGGTLKAGKSRVFHGIDKTYPNIAVVGLGKRSSGISEQEERRECKENIRIAVAAGVRNLREVGCKKVIVDPCSDAQAAAEGAFLSEFKFDDLKAESKRMSPIDISLWINTASQDNEKWINGRILAKSQNFARKLMEMPANKLTPTVYGEMVSKELVNAASSMDPSVLSIRIHQQDWIERQKMGAFLSVAKGSCEPPIFVEVKYNGKDGKSNPLVLVGKGVTFDSGGISIKPSQGMDLMRADMGGAANVAGAIWAAVSMQLPINLVGLVPLCENLPSGIAVKPGDVVTAMNGKTIQVDNTDAEGRLLLADALCYACKTYQPSSLIDLATLTGAIDVALGSGATGVFSNNQNLWKQLHESGVESGDRMWRMPLFDHYSKQVTESHLADLNNIGKYARSGGSCTAAAFLKEFVSCSSWAHLDIAGVMQNQDEIPYLGKGMSGRPVRTLVEFLRRHAT